MAASDYGSWFDTIAELVLHHSPSGDEAAINGFLLDRLHQLGLRPWLDGADNVITKISGQDSSRAIAITAHKDEIGAIVKSLDEAGRVSVQRLGGAFPWVYGEGVFDLLGDNRTVSGILSFGSRHVSHESPQKQQQQDELVRWEDAWIETKQTPEDLEAAGIRPGTRVVVGKHRKKPFRLGDYIASYTLDNKASVAILLALAQTLKQPAVDVFLVASAKEEVGAIGALYFSQQQRLDALVALEICPVSTEYPIDHNESPVLLSQDAYGIYDESLNRQIRQAARLVGIDLQLALLNGFGSDASIAMKFGHVPKGACLSFPTENTHGYEIAHLGAIAACAEVLRSFCETYE
jgi:putative aminopeptidase FrvX